MLALLPGCYAVQRPEAAPPRPDHPSDPVGTRAVDEGGVDPVGDVGVAAAPDADQPTGAVGGGPDGEGDTSGSTDEASEIAEADEPSEDVTANADAQPETDQTDDATGEPDSVDTENQES